MNGAELKSLRLKLQLTQAQMAERLGISWITYSRYERGKWPLNKTVKILCEGLAREI